MSAEVEYALTDFGPFFASAVLHFHVPPSEVWDLTAGEYWALARCLNPDIFTEVEQGINKIDKSFFCAEELAIFEELKKKHPNAIIKDETQ